MKAFDTSLSAFSAPDAFQAARPLCAGASGRRSRGEARDQSSSSEAAARPVAITLADLTEGPYFQIATMLDCKSLCLMDAVCRLHLLLNNANAHVSPWRSLGARTFCSLELENDGTFEQPVVDMELQNSRKFARIDWKGRFRRFRAEVATFVPPFGGSTIMGVVKPDEVAYFRSRLCTDEESLASQGVYLE